MPKINLRWGVQKNESGVYTAVVKLGGYATEEQAENIARAIKLMIAESAQGSGIRVTKQLPTEHIPG